MKCLKSSQTIKEFNETLKEGFEQGFILQDSDLDFLKELYVNLAYYFTFFVVSNGKKES